MLWLRVGVLALFLAVLGRAEEAPDYGAYQGELAFAAGGLTAEQTDVWKVSWGGAVAFRVKSGLDVYFDGTNAKVADTDEFSARLSYFGGGLRAEFRGKPSHPAAPYVKLTAGYLQSVANTFTGGFRREAAWRFGWSPGTGVNISLGPAWGLHVGVRGFKARDSLWLYDVSTGIFLRFGERE